MKNIYLIKWETTNAFTTARKLAEYAKKTFEWDATIWKDGSTYEKVRLQDIPTEKLITLINKGSVEIDDGYDRARLEKVEVI
jgi:hypothetical protein